MLLCRISVLGLVVAAAVVVGAAGSAALGWGPVAAQTPIPCNPQITRTISPLIVEEGGELDVRVEYNMVCTGQSPVLNFFLLVENTSALMGPRRAVLNNAKVALTNFVNQVDYRNGSKGGLTLYAQTYTNPVTLRGGDDGREALLSAIQRLSFEPIGEMAGATGAIRDSTERLPTGIPGTINMLLILDAGAQMDPNGPTLSDLSSSCKAARDAGVLTYVVGRPGSGNRLCGQGCCTGGFKYSSAQDGSDLPKVYGEFADEILKGKMATAVEYYDHISSKFEFIPGSGVPKQPNNPYGSEYTWPFPPPGPSGQVIEYRVRVGEGVADEMAKLSLRSELYIVYQDHSDAAVPVDNPDICIHRAGDPSFCAGPAQTQTAMAVSPTPSGQTPTPTTGVETATPTAETPTPRVTETLTPVPTEPTPTPTESETPRHSIYLPALLKMSEFGSG